MNTTRRTAWSMALLLLTSVGTLSSAWAEDEVAAHLTKAVSYEEKAKVQQNLIDEHQHMLLAQFNEHITPEPIVRRQNEHCNAIVRDATKLRDDLLDFAKWHRMRAAELREK